MHCTLLQYNGQTQWVRWAVYWRPSVKAVKARASERAAYKDSQVVLYWMNSTKYWQARFSLKLSTFLSWKVFKHLELRRFKLARRPRAPWPQAPKAQSVGCFSSVEVILSRKIAAFSEKGSKSIAGNSYLLVNGSKPVKWITLNLVGNISRWVIRQEVWQRSTLITKTFLSTSCLMLPWKVS